MTDMYGDRPELWEQTGDVVNRQLLSIDTLVLFLKEMAYLGLPYVPEYTHADHPQAQGMLVLAQNRTQK
ncbi:MAG: hypothetical protein G5701_03030 [Serratia symbiotica]|nr:hypothetical protein [Serratia symbiotica]